MILGHDWPHWMARRCNSRSVYGIRTVRRRQNSGDLSALYNGRYHSESSVRLRRKVWEYRVHGYSIWRDRRSCRLSSVVWIRRGLAWNRISNSNWQIVPLVESSITKIVKHLQGPRVVRGCTRKNKRDSAALAGSTPPV